MSVTLRKVTKDDIRTVWEMQIKAFKDLLAVYQDYEMSPGAESIDKVEARFNQPWTTKRTAPGSAYPLYG